jgi:putative peptide zinc metalloprotease protein
MTATAEPPVPAAEAPPTVEATTRPPLDRGEGVELLGDIHGCGYRDGACLVRRADGQMVQLGTLMYALLEQVDGQRDTGELAGALSARLGRRVGEQHVARLAQKLAQQGLLAGTEGKAPPRRNPLLALRWKVLVTNPNWTKRLTAPFSFLLRPWLMWPIVLCFGGVFWFVLIHKGVAGATAQAFRDPGLFLLVFALAVVSAGFHELGHAAAAKYGGATPGGMGMGLYLVWPAFYTDVTDAYRLPKVARLRVDLAGLYFNAVVAVLTMGAWLIWRVDALLLLVALQVLQMVKQLSPIIRADGYHILSDATGVPDLYAHMGPTMRRLIPWRHNEPSALTGRARFLVTVWVLIVVPVLLALMLGAILMLPRLATSAWDSGRHIVTAIPRDASHGQIIDMLALIVSLAALILPVLGSLLVTQKIIRTVVLKGREWSQGRPVRRGIVLAAAAAAFAAAAWAWWPSGQYQPVRANGNGTIGGLVKLVSSPVAAARPNSQTSAAVHLTPGTHLAVSMIPVGGASKKHPALFLITQGKGKPPVAIVSSSAPDPTGAPTASSPGAGSTSSTPTTTSAPAATSSTVGATAFPFQLPKPPGPGGTQALAANTTNGGVKYDVAYSLVTVKNGAPVTNSNSAYALADCDGCTTVAVSFQIVLIVGQTKDIAPINAAGALNYDCPACTTTAIADQIVVTLKSQPSPQLVAELESDLKRLNELSALGANGTPGAVASEVANVQQEVETQLSKSGQLASPPSSNNTSTTQSSTTTNPSSAPATGQSGSSSSAGSSGTSGQSSSSGGGGSSSSDVAPTTTSSAPSSTTTSTTPTTTPTTTTTTSSSTSSSSDTGTTG